MNVSNGWQLFLFVIVPYMALTTFLIGHIWRYRFDQFGWTSRSSQLYEKKMLLFGSPLFHYGALLAIMGHAVGLLLPQSYTQAIGIPESVYSLFAKMGGTAAAGLVVVGLGILTFRRAANDRVRRATTPMDTVAISLLWAMVALGFGLSVIYNLLGPGYDYRPTVSVWLRSLVWFHPNVGGIASAPAVYQVHVTLAWVFLAVFPFTRFVHFWSAPVWYMSRPFVLYRRRRWDAILSPGESKGWQRFGDFGRSRRH